MKYTVFANQQFGFDEIKQVIDAPSNEAAVEWAKLWVGGLTRVCGEDFEWRKEFDGHQSVSVSSNAPMKIAGGSNSLEGLGVALSILPYVVLLVVGIVMIYRVLVSLGGA